MTLPSSGSITLAQAAAEYGLSLPVVLPNSFWGKPGLPASGAIVLPGDFYGKSNVTFTPDGGAVSDFGEFSAGVDLVASLPVTWTYTGGGAGGAVNLSSGGVGTLLAFTLFSPGTATWSVTGTLGGTSRNFTVSLIVGGL